ncbi:MAG TPA: hypothetical protein VLF20_02685 [Patescibacteria group bacterium]|nr:hypothetical protein [Patescibacteria group bacterium]
MRERPKYPPTFFAASLRGTGEFPQMHAAQTLRGGVAVLTEIMNGRLTWDTFFRSDITKEQAIVVRQKMYDLHLAFGIPLLPKKTSRDQKQAYRARHPHQKIRSFPLEPGFLLSTDKRKIIRAAVHFAQAIVPQDKQPNPALKNFSAQWKYNLPARDLNIPLLTHFFADPAYQKDVQTLLTLWQTATDTLNTPAARAVGKTLRDSLTGKTTRKRRTEITNQALITLQGLIRRSLDTNFNHIEPATRDQFIADVVTRGLLR